MIGWALAGGVCNGLGAVVFYGALADSSATKLDVSTLVPMSTVCIVVITTVGAWLLFNERLTPTRIGSIALAIAAIWMAR